MAGATGTVVQVTRLSAIRLTILDRLIKDPGQERGKSSSGTRMGKPVLQVTVSLSRWKWECHLCDLI